MRVLIAPDKFKHAVSALQACQAIASGVRSAAHNAQLDLCPLGDGGEGTGEILAACIGPRAAPRYRAQRVTVDDPLGRAVQATWWWDKARRSAIVELAQASGLSLLRRRQRAPLRTSTHGTGQLIRLSLEQGAREVLLAVGGSATVDGGAGILQALGWRFFDHAGQIIDAHLSGGRLSTVGAISAPSPLPAARFVILVDVDNPLLGPQGAARVYGPQKGANSLAVAELERGLENWAGILKRRAPESVDFHADPFLGASGGVPAGLLVELHAQITRGFDHVASSCNLSQRMKSSHLCLTGEGRLDAQTSSGKVVAGVARLAAAAGVPCIALVGSAPGDSIERIQRQLGLRSVLVISSPGEPLRIALRRTRDNLARCAADAVRGLMIKH